MNGQRSNGWVPDPATSLLPPLCPDWPGNRFYREAGGICPWTNSKFGTDKKIWLKARRNLPMISHTLGTNLWIIRVHQFVAREISVLRGQKSVAQLSTSELHLCHPHRGSEQKTRPTALYKHPRVTSNGKHFQPNKFV